MRKALLIAVVVTLCSFYAAAQDYPKGELGAGWDFLHIPSLPAENNWPGGFFVDGTYYFAEAIGLTGDFQFHQKSVAGVTARIISFHGGPRLKARMGKTEPFAHALFGVSHFTVTGTSSENAFSMKLGGGLDLAAAPHFAIRVGEFNYYMTRFGSETQNNITLGVGVVLR